MAYCSSFNDCAVDNHNLNQDPVKCRSDWVNTSFDHWSSSSAFSDSSIDLSSPLTTSLSSDCFSVGSGGASLDCTQTSSTISPNVSTWSDTFVTPPTTPRKAQPWRSSTPVNYSASSFANSYFHLETHANVLQAEDKDLWTPKSWQIPILPLTDCRTPAQCFNDDMDDCSLLPFAPYTTDPALSRSIFSDQLYSLPHQHAGVHSYHDDRPSTTSWSALTTIAPQAISQPVLSSSPMTKIEVSTPVKMEDFARVSQGLDSSPLPTPTPLAVPSQTSQEDFEIHDEVLATTVQPVLTRTPPNRSLRRSSHRTSMASMVTKPRRVLNRITCDVVIPQNSFACTVPGCVDKNTGRQKRFKRQEHRKRHEQTVHINPATPRHFCWVEGCSTGFSRADNLKNHVKTTHGKQNPAQRNRYVASLDPKSKFYEPDWRGKLTEDGYPMKADVTVRRCHVGDCGKTYHLEDKLKTHLLQHHGKKSLGTDTTRRT